MIPRRGYNKYWVFPRRKVKDRNYDEKFFVKLTGTFNGKTRTYTALGLSAELDIEWNELISDSELLCFSQESDIKSMRIIIELKDDNGVYGHIKDIL